jgi:hypothetical protein
MSYTDGGMREFRLAESAAVKTGSNHGTFQPIYQPVVVRAVAGLVTTALGSNDAVATFTKRDLVTGSNISTTTLTLGSGLAAGKVVYEHGLDIELSPSEDIVVASSGNANGNVSYSVVYEPKPETPANNSDMSAA